MESKRVGIASIFRPRSTSRSATKCPKSAVGGVQSSPASLKKVDRPVIKSEDGQKLLVNGTTRHSQKGKVIHRIALYGDEGIDSDVPGKCPNNVTARNVKAKSLTEERKTDSRSPPQDTKTGHAKYEHQTLPNNYRPLAMQKRAIVYAEAASVATESRRVVHCTKEDKTRRGEEALTEARNLAGHLEPVIQSSRCISDLNKLNCSTAACVPGQRETLFVDTGQYASEKKKTDCNEVNTLAVDLEQYISTVFKFLDTEKSGYISRGDYHTLLTLIKCDSKLYENKEMKSEGLEKFPVDSIVNYNKFLYELKKIYSGTTEISSIVNRRQNEALINAVDTVGRRRNMLDEIHKNCRNVKCHGALRMSDGDKDLFCDAKMQASNEYCNCCHGKYYNSVSAWQEPRFKVDWNCNIFSNEERFCGREICPCEKKIISQQQEILCLREIVKDLKTALQSSDAENLALEVKLEKMNRLLDASTPDNRSFKDVCLTDEEDSIDSLIRHIARLSPLQESKSGDEEKQKRFGESQKEGDFLEMNVPVLERPRSLDMSVEEELQKVQSELAILKDDLTATQRDLQLTVAQLQQKCSECKDLSSALERNQHLYTKKQSENTDINRKLRQLEEDLLAEKLRWQKAQREVGEWKIRRQKDFLELQKLQEIVHSVEKRRREDMHSLTEVRTLIFKVFQHFEEEVLFSGSANDSRLCPESNRREREVKRGQPDMRQIPTTCAGKFQGSCCSSVLQNDVGKRCPTTFSNSPSVTPSAHELAELHLLLSSLGCEDAVDASVLTQNIKTSTKKKPKSFRVRFREDIDEARPASGSRDPSVDADVPMSLMSTSMPHLDTCYPRPAGINITVPEPQVLTEFEEQMERSLEAQVESTLSEVDEEMEEFCTDFVFPDSPPDSLEGSIASSPTTSWEGIPLTKRNLDMKGETPGVPVTVLASNQHIIEKLEEQVENLCLKLNIDFMQCDHIPCETYKFGFSYETAA